jgi:hypothetical protein
MKTKKELETLSGKIGEAIYAYHNAIFENLKESGKEHTIVDSNEEDEKGVHLTVGVGVLTIDKVRFNAELGVNGAVEVHICEEDCRDTDKWVIASILGYDIDYVYDNIIWD